MAYATISDVLLYMREPAGTDDERDLMIQRMLDGASALFDNYARVRRRSFVSFASVTETFTFLPYSAESRILRIKDLLEPTSVKLDLDADGVYETTITSPAQYRLRGNRLPYTAIEISPGRSFTTVWWETWPGARVEITGRWGLADTVPDDVRHAVIEETVRMYRGSQNNFLGAVVGQDNPNVIYEKAISARVALILQNYKSVVFA